MRISLILLSLVALAGCSTQEIAHYSPYDLNRDGIMDARCPGMEYDTSEYRHYSWRSDGSEECNEKVNSQNDAS
jgi:hypothetical protein